MYALNIYDKILDQDWYYNFTKPISPQQALDIVNKLEFEIQTYGKLDDPLYMFVDKNNPCEYFGFRLSNYNYVNFDKLEFSDYLLDDER